MDLLGASQVSQVNLGMYIRETSALRRKVNKTRAPYAHARIVSMKINGTQASTGTRAISGFEGLNMYVSTSLRVLDVDAQDERMLSLDFTVISGDDLQTVDPKTGKAATVPAPRTVYRRLDPDYYAWLRARIGAAKQAADSGRIDPAAVSALVAKFRTIHAAAVATFGEEALRQSCTRMADAQVAGQYAAPVADADARGVVGRDDAARTEPVAPGKRAARRAR